MTIRALLGALLFALAPLSAWAAGSVPGTALGGSGSSVTTITIANFAVPAGTGDATIILSVGAERASATPAAYGSATWNGRTFTLQASQTRVNGSASQHAAIASLPQADRGVTGPLVINVTALASSLRAIAYVADGLGAAEAICAPCGAATGETVSSSVTPLTASAYLTDAFSSSLVSTTWVPAAGQTVVAASNGGSMALIASDGVGPATPAATTFSWSHSGSAINANLAHVMVAFAVPPPPEPEPGPCASDYMPPTSETGLIDITADANCPGIVADGVTDVTAALQSCVSYYANHNKLGGDNSRESEDTLCAPDGDLLVSGEVEGIAPPGVTGTRERAYLGLRGCGGKLATRIVLAENSPGFGDPNHPKPIFRFGNPGDLNNPDPNSPLSCCSGSAARNGLRNIAFVIRAGNPGAVAVDYMGNNAVPTVRDVKVTADASSCFAGIRLATKWPGPMLFENVEVEGCGYSVQGGYPYANVMFENLTARNQTIAGANVYLQEVTFKNFTSSQSIPGVPALLIQGQQSKGGPLVQVLGGDFAGSGPAAVKMQLLAGSQAQYKPQALFRGVTTAGYTNALDYVGSMTAVMPAELSTRPVSFVLPSAGESLNLPIPDHPQMKHPKASDWVSFAAFGAIPNDGIDDTAAIQAAIDSGKKVAFCPAGIWSVTDTFVLRGAFERMVGFDCFFRAIGDSMRPVLDGVQIFKPAFIADASLTHDVEIENIRLDRGNRDSSPFPEPRFIHRSPHAVILTDDLHVTSYVSEAGAGPLYAESTCCDQVRGLGGNDLYLRMVNVEDGPTPASGDPTGYPDVECVGPGKCVVLGFKNENRFGPFITARGGAQLEALGAFFYSDIQGTSQGPVFECIESQCALSYLGYGGSHWSPQARVVRGGVEALLGTTSPGGVSRATFNTLFVENAL